MKRKERREVYSGPSILGDARAEYIQNLKQDWYRGHYFPFVKVIGTRVRYEGSKIENTEKALTVYLIIE
jgi:hypothetical protein